MGTREPLTSLGRQWRSSCRSASRFGRLFSAGMTDDAPHVADNLLRTAEVVHAGEVSVSFENGPTVRAKVGDALLDIAEASQVPIESGCRMGMCGSDPVRIVQGVDNLSSMRSAERRTLDRLG